MGHCPSCHAEITEADLKAGACTQCGFALVQGSLNELLVQLGLNQKCMGIVKRAFDSKSSAKKE